MKRRDERRLIVYSARIMLALPTPIKNKKKSRRLKKLGDKKSLFLRFRLLSSASERSFPNLTKLLVLLNDD